MEGDMRVQLDLASCLIDEVSEEVRYNYDPEDPLYKLTIAQAKLARVLDFLVRKLEE